jgi:hypothetical protein
MAATQTYTTHKKYVPGYHGVLFALLLVNLGWAVRQLLRETTGDRVVGLLTAVAVVLIAFYARGFAMKVQDRVIRLEERARLARVLPDSLRPRIEELSTSQLVALRFASDAELPDLVRRVLSEGIREQDAIKRLVTQWRPDYTRA